MAVAIEAAIAEGKEVDAATILAGVTADEATKDSALAEVTAIEAPVDGETSILTTRLVDLDDANTALTDFFASIDLDADGEPDFVDAEGVVDATDSAALQAAKLQDTRDADADTLTDAQANLVTA